MFQSVDEVQQHFRGARYIASRRTVTTRRTPVFSLKVSSVRSSITWPPLVSSSTCRIRACSPSARARVTARRKRIKSAASGKARGAPEAGRSGRFSGHPTERTIGDRGSGYSSTSAKTGRRRSWRMTWLGPVAMCQGSHYLTLDRGQSRVPMSGRSREVPGVIVRPAIPPAAGRCAL